MIYRRVKPYDESDCRATDTEDQTLASGDNQDRWECKVRDGLDWFKRQYFAERIHGTT